MMSVKRFWALCATGFVLLILLFAWGLSYFHLSQYTETVGNRLQLLNELRKGALEQYFSTAEAELNFWSTNPDILATQKKFNSLWRKSLDKPLALSKLREFYVSNNPFPVDEYRELDDAGDGSEYSAVHSRLQPMSKLFVTVRGYYDVFLIGAEGDVFYSVEKEADFATNLLHGQWRETGLAKVFREAVARREQKGLIISDMEPYGPSQDAPAIFIARALEDADGELLGVIAFQLPTQKILAIMNYTVGMGETGETYLVGQDSLMRSDSRFTEQSGVLSQSVQTATVAKALKGQQGVEFISDYRDVDVLSAYTNLRVGQTSWAVMAEMDREEIALTAAEERPNMTGILLFFYGLSLWSVWYWRGRHLPEGQSEYASLELDASDFGDNVG